LDKDFYTELRTNNAYNKYPVFYDKALEVKLLSEFALLKIETFRKDCPVFLNNVQCEILDLEKNCRSCEHCRLQKENWENAHTEGYVEFVCSDFSLKSYYDFFTSVCNDINEARVNFALTESVLYIAKESGSLLFGKY
jgi:hypothetical protein